VTVEIRSRPSQGPIPELIWIEEVVALAEASASAPLYPLLKREDERHVTMQAYDNPAFVEDIVRDVAIRLQNDERIIWFRVHALNQESIHNHNAFAQIAWSRP
jgi:GTP cyclohydrolase I